MTTNGQSEQKLPAAAPGAPNLPEPYDMAPFGCHRFSLRDRRRKRCWSAVGRQYRC